jgi:hypothetical protein
MDEWLNGWTYDYDTFYTRNKDDIDDSSPRTKANAA